MLFANTHTYIFSLHRTNHNYGTLQTLLSNATKYRGGGGGDTLPPYFWVEGYPPPAFPALSFITVCVTNIMLYISVYSMGCKCDSKPMVSPTWEPRNGDESPSHDFTNSPIHQFTNSPILLPLGGETLVNW